MISKQFFSKGKLLISGEYFVLDGTCALAIPTKFGQRLEVKTDQENENSFSFHSFNIDKEQWFSGLFDVQSLAVISTTDAEVAQRLVSIFQSMFSQKPSCKDHLPGLSFSTYLEFPNDWGLGSSSTLLHLLGQWSGADPFIILEDTFGGSGYDIACAGANGPILYERKKGIPNFKNVPFNPSFSKDIHFVHLGKKQNSRLGITHYRNKKNKAASTYQALTELGDEMVKCTERSVFCQLIDQHETLISEALSLEKVKDLHFSSFPGSVKSLGAWGGDFVMALAEKEDFDARNYFRQLGFTTCLSFKEMIG